MDKKEGIRLLSEFNLSLSTQVPLYILVLGFSPRRAIPLSNVTILVRRKGREGWRERRGSDESRVAYIRTIYSSLFSIHE